MKSHFKNELDKSFTGYQEKLETEHSVKRTRNFQDNIQSRNEKMFEYTHVSNKKAKFQQSSEKDTHNDKFETLEHAFNQAILFDDQIEVKKYGHFMEKIDNESEFDSDDDYDCSSESDRDRVIEF